MVVKRVPEQRLPAEKITRAGLIGLILLADALVPNTAAAGSKKNCDYTVRSGDTLSAIAKNASVPLADLITANPQITDPHWIYPGEPVNLCPGTVLPLGGGGDSVPFVTTPQTRPAEKPPAQQPQPKHADRLTLNNKVAITLAAKETKRIAVTIKAGDNQLILTSDREMTPDSLSVYSPDQVETLNQSDRAPQPKGRGNICPPSVANDYPGCVAFWQGGHWGQDRDWQAAVTNFTDQSVIATLQLSGNNVDSKNCFGYWENYPNGLRVFWTECQRAP